ncbi:MAG: acyloxyacyl hydrolase [Flavobacteriales bacterium]|nr:acyloxyacyl hydrolase [Flavobacteriia bacterium]NCP07128.1 acyloxyacyl hydrolase [Flavobacteriales bacterium]PIV93247.1 MAG: deacylase [Flavobacteriaceae bacterium CG17_big_fil_post_rev_8_21_14_2_50_33_15]PJB19692.1 MAG: deacylase [Flavobacteriaceae bacterium CG_4_9_14_3_um_filter_33_16]NCP51037.1 acyloxyacyl hydrolase [Flavobacteriales bacterium]
MKLFFVLGFCLVVYISFSQEKQNTSYMDVNYFKGYIPLHNNDILHLITGHPEGVILSWNKKTYGYQDWEQRFNYPDYGFSFAFQNLKNEVLGNNYSLYAHYNFYFLNRNLMFRVGQGLALTTNPFNKETNFRNNAFGSKIMSSTFMMLNYKKERLFDQFGLQAGFSLIHYSNANVKAPNTSINSIALNIGVNYNFDADEPKYILADSTELHQKFTEPIKYNVVFRTGVNESDVVGSGQFPFYTFSAYADKRINQKSALQFGADVFFSNFLREFIFYRSVSFPEEQTTGNEDYKRVGLFVGHELFVNKLSLVTQLGYYVYYPFDFEGRTYLRIGLKRYFGKKWFWALTLKAHAAKAEAVEFGVGVRL